MIKRRMHANKGFTIIELMLSMVVFSLVLLITMAAILQITRLYYRGVTQTNTQEATRAVVDEISQAIQFSNSKIATPKDAMGQETNPTGPEVLAGEDNDTGLLCIGGRRYSFAIDRKVVNANPQSKEKLFGLWVDEPEFCDPGLGTTALDLDDEAAVSATGGRELLEENMRLTKFEIVQVSSADPSLWKLDIAIVYGDEDLQELNQAGDRKVCKPSGPGIEFCATSEISTTVRRRVE